MNVNLSIIDDAMNAAVKCARQYVGATHPNPAVGAAGLDASGNLLGVAAHKRSGSPHAEIELFHYLERHGTLSELHTLVVTLEPCSHHGRTPPCAERILEIPNIRQVVYGALDVNPLVAGKGAQLIRNSGRDVLLRSSPEVERLNAPFFHWVRTGLPYVVVKQALNREGSMIPPLGQKTFTSTDSLQLAHTLRRESGAIITGSGTVLADDPEFTVRLVEEHQDAPERILVVLDRRERVRSPKYRVGNNYFDELKKLGKQGVTQVLVEAGPTLTRFVFESGLWNESVVISQAKFENEPDRIEIKQNLCFQESLNKQPESLT